MAKRWLLFICVVGMVSLPIAAYGKLVNQYTFEDGTAKDRVGGADANLVGDAKVVGGSLVLDGDGDWMAMPGAKIAMNTFDEVSVEAWFTSVEGGNTGFHMLAAFGEEATGALDWAGYKYLFISPARGDNVSRAAIMTRSMGSDPWAQETGVSATVEHDDGVQHHFVATVNATDIAFYIDGELIGTQALDPNNAISGIGTAVAYVGKGVYPADPLWKGSVEEFSIYNTALSEEQVLNKFFAGPAKLPVNQYTFEDGTARDIAGGADANLVGNAAIVGGSLVLDANNSWMEMPGAQIAMNTFPELSIEAWFTSVAGGNTGFHMLAAFGEEATGALDWAGYKYLFISPARGDNVSRAAIMTRSMGSDPWAQETGVSATVEHDDGVQHHFVATVNATDIAFYIDGELIGTQALDPNNAISGIGTAVARVGKGVYPADPLWAGSVEEFSIYRSALNADQVLTKFFAGPAKLPVNQYTFEDGTAKDSAGGADANLVGDAAIVDGSLVLDGSDAWMAMPGAQIAMNTFDEVSVEAWFTSVEGGNTGFHMLAAFGEEGTGAAATAGYKYLFISPARGDNVSRAAIQTKSMDSSPWDDETGVSATVEHDDGVQHHFVATVNATDIAFYIDGELIGTTALAEGNAISGIGTAAAFVGKGVYPADPLWKGSVEEFNVYRSALTADQVLTKFFAGPAK